MAWSTLRAHQILVRAIRRELLVQDIILAIPVMRPRLPWERGVIERRGPSHFLES